MARNAFGLALLAVLAVSGCSQLDNLPFLGNKKAKEAEVRAAALRVRTTACGRLVVPRIPWRKFASRPASTRFAPN